MTVSLPAKDSGWAAVLVTVGAATRSCSVVLGCGRGTEGDKLCAKQRLCDCDPQHFACIQRTKACYTKSVLVVLPCVYLEISLPLEIDGTSKRKRHTN